VPTHIKWNELNHFGDKPMTPQMHPAPDREVILSDGSRHRLKDFWKSHPLLLVFLRHLG
jgi:hypothetical protein